MAGPSFRAAPARVRVPATSANLGPGFDSFGLALAWYDDVVVRVSDEKGVVVDVAGEGAETVGRDESNLVVRAMHAAFDLLGGRPRGLEVVCANRIPHGRGLGSSAAAIVAGVTAAKAITIAGRDKLDDAATLALVTEMEGHPDNVAAALHGGFTISWVDTAGQPAVIRLDPHPSVVPVVFVPPTEVTTASARAMLPESVPHREAASSVARGALLVEALTRRPGLLLEATADVLHQPYRRAVMPESLALVDTLRAAGYPAVISGAGPSVLALVTAQVVPDLATQAPPGWGFHRLVTQPTGVAVLPLAA